ncbi:MAG: tRNA epoxyqueuosine(34) reductase QueG [Myxococcota bacterium]|nr:tRNA epoxyqueuosine(34) reductase QueG [Myxococcota bacterium]
MVDSYQEPPNPKKVLNQALVRGDLAAQHYLPRSASWRGQPDRLLKGGKSVISRLYRYHCEPDQAEHDPHCGMIASYARGSDYHRVLKDTLLEELSEELRQRHGRGIRLRPAVDSAPLFERDLAFRKGLGWYGRQGSIIHPEVGASGLLAQLVVDREIDAEEELELHPDRCGTCRLCIQVCPTSAIHPDGYRVDSRRCISYWTIETRGMIPRWIRERMGRRVFGCDDCTMVCPWNRRSSRDVPAGLEPRRENMAPRLLELLEDCVPERFEGRFAKSPVLRAGWDGMARNVLIAMGNSDALNFKEVALERFRSTPSEVVRATALWTYFRHGGDPSIGRKDPSQIVQNEAEDLLSDRPSEAPSPAYLSG